ncbi:MAG TPA: MFS transporter, partial [Chlamydiales bacterium]|nr:MFS transporter [Chlamydiales bacterium]
MTAFTKSRTVAWMVWLTASIFYAYQYILRVMPSILLEDVCQQFNIGAAAFGQFSGIYYIGYSALHLPIGILLDRVGPKKVMSISILLTTIGLLPLLFAEHWGYPVAGRALIGIGSSAAILGLFKIIRMSFSEARFARMLSISVTIGLIGAIYGGTPVSMMRDAFGYKAVIECFAFVGLALALATYWIIPNFKTESSGTVLSDVKEVLTNRRVLLLCLSAGFMVGPLEGFADVWG